MTGPTPWSLEHGDPYGSWNGKKTPVHKYRTQKQLLEDARRQGLNIVRINKFTYRVVPKKEAPKSKTKSTTIPRRSSKYSVKVRDYYRRPPR